MYGIQNLLSGHARDLFMVHAMFLCLAILGFMILPGVYTGAQPATEPPPPVQVSKTTEIIFVPYDKMTGPEFGMDQSIMIPYAEFLKLKRAAEGDEVPEDFKPVVSLVLARYTGTITGDLAEFDVEMEIDMLAPPHKRLELVHSGETGTKPHFKRGV